MSAIIRVRKDKGSIEADKHVKFYIGINKVEQKLNDEEISFPVDADVQLELKACFCGFLGEQSSVERLILAPGSIIYFEVFYEGMSLRLKEIVAADATVPATTTAIQPTGIRVSETQNALKCFSLWLDGKKIRDNYASKGETFIPVPADGQVHTFRASSFWNKTHKSYFTLEEGQQMDFILWQGPKAIWSARRVGFQMNNNTVPEESPKSASAE